MRWEQGKNMKFTLNVGMSSLILDSRRRQKLFPTLLPTAQRPLQVNLYRFAKHLNSLETRLRLIRIPAERY